MLDFIAGPWGALIGKAMMVMTLVAIIYVGVAQYNRNISEKQMLKDQNAQLVQLQKDNQELSKRLVTLEKVNNDILIKLDAKNDKVIEKHDTVNNYIQSPQAQKSNRPASDVIKKTVGMLND